MLKTKGSSGSRFFVGSILAIGIVAATVRAPAAGAGGGYLCIEEPEIWNTVVDCVVRGYLSSGPPVNSDDPDQSVIDPPEPPYNSIAPIEYEWVYWWAPYGVNASLQACFYLQAGHFPADVAGSESLRRTIGYGTDQVGADRILNDLMRSPPRVAGPCTDTADFLRDGGPPAIPSSDELWDLAQVFLPTPEPVIPPGRGLAGLEMTLETTRPLSVARTGIETSVGLVLDATATGTFTLDWGDGSPVEGPFDQPGAARDPDDLDSPDAITHTWIDADHYTISVVDSWTVTFTDQYGRTSTASGQMPPASLDFEVQELQAVITD